MTRIVPAPMFARHAFYHCFYRKLSSTVAPAGRVFTRLSKPTLAPNVIGNWFSRVRNIIVPAVAVTRGMCLKMVPSPQDNAGATMVLHCGSSRRMMLYLNCYSERLSPKGLPSGFNASPLLMWPFLPAQLACWCCYFYCAPIAP